MPTLLEKLNKIYEKIDHIEKRGRNKNQGYNYVKAADLAHAVRNAFLELGIYAEVTFKYIRGYEFETAKGTKMQAVDVQCDIKFYDISAPTINGVSNSYYTTGLGSGSDTTDKAIYKAQTGALKYALRNAFIVPDEVDPENDSEDVVEEEAVPSSKAVIPKLPTKPKVASKVSTEESTTVKPTGVSVDSSEDLPKDRTLTAEEKEAVKNNCKIIVADLIDAGLKPSKGYSHEKKFLVYLLKETGANNFDGITRNRWDVFQKNVNRIKTNDGTKALVVEVNSACGV